MTTRRRCLLLASLALTGCSDPESVTVVFVTVDSRAGVTGVSQLEVTLRNEGSTVSEQLDLDGESLPVTFTVTPTDRTGALDVQVAGMDADGGLRGEGRMVTDIAQDDRVDVTITLDPTDFPVNADIAGTQRLTFDYDHAGRQVAGNDDGFYVTFVNDCEMLGRCDVLARRFDPAGTPTVNQTSQNDGDFIVNLTSEFTSQPAIATGAASMFIAWDTTEGIKGVAMSADGDHQTATETLLSTTMMFTQGPAVAVLASGEYIVVWSEAQIDGSDTIRGRFVNASGVPQINPITGDNLDFPVSVAEPGIAARPYVASTGEGRGFVVVWTYADDFFEPTNVRARFFTSTGVAAFAQNGRLTTYTDGDVFGPKVVSIGSNRAMVAYFAQTASDPRLEDGAIVFSRFTSPAGNPEGAPYIVPLEVPGFQPHVPSMVLRDDGAIGAAWHDCGAQGDGQGCGVFVQALRTTGVPVGAPIIVNTTVVGDQETPSIAPLPDSFVVTWTDGSMAPPDTAELGIRGRIVYPDIDPTDGRLGARCGRAGDADCLDSLACIAGSDGVPACYSVCDAAEITPCPRGGVCTTVAGESACVF